MKFKKLTKQLLPILLFSSICGSCTIDDNAKTDVLQQKPEASINVSLTTRSTDPNATETELMIKTAYVYIYNSLGVLENRDNVLITGSIMSSGNTLNKQWLVVTGVKDIYVVTNPDTELATRLTGSLTKAQLLQLITDQSGWNVSSFASRGMLMSGHTNINVNTTNATANVAIGRRHARIDFQLKTADDLTGSAVKLKSVTLKEQEQVGAVIATGTSSYDAYTQKSSATNELTPAVTIGAAFTPAALTSFYTYPRPAAHNSAALCLQMVVDINGTEKVIDVYINSGALNGNTANDPNQSLEISSNFIYRVQATLYRKTVDVGIALYDWEDQPVNAPIYGATLAVDKVDVKMDCAIIKDRTLVISYKSNTNATVSVVTEQPSWLTIAPSAETFPNLSGTITLTHNGAVAATVLTANQVAIIKVTAGGISRQIKVHWVLVDTVN